MALPLCMEPSQDGSYVLHVLGISLFLCARRWVVHMQALICDNAQKTMVEFYAVPCGAFPTSFLPSWVTPEAEGLEVASQPTA